MNAPEIAVDYRKRHKIQQAAQRYLRESGDKSIPRIDLVAVSMLPYGAQMMYFQGK
jgi:Holliday junction resolvase-like predicted endonuclease